MKATVIIFLIFFLYICSGFGQEKEVKKGESAYGKGNYKEALEYFTKAINKGAKLDDALKEKVGDCYFNLGDENSAKEYFAEISVNDISGKAAENYGKILQSAGEYDKAKDYYEVAIDRGSKNLALNNYIESCKWALKNTGLGMFQLSSTGLQINSKAYGVSFYGNSIIYAARSEKKTKDALGDNTTDLYSAILAGSTPGVPKILQGKLNSSDNEGGVCFSPDQKTIYFTRIVVEKDGKKTYKLMQSENKGSGWDSPKEMSINNSKYNCAYPAMGPDENTLYFASDMPGGLGQFDIYVVEKQGNKWTAPKNLGDKINTPGNEVFPSISETGIFYFASDGLPGYGGLDIFSAEGQETEWTNITNLKMPVNTLTDDFGFAWNDEGDFGFLCSNRNRVKDSHNIYTVFKKPPEEIAQEVNDDKKLDSIIDSKSNESDSEIAEAINALSGDSLQNQNDSLGIDLSGLIEENDAQKSNSSTSGSLSDQLKALRGPDAVIYRVQFLSSRKRLDKLTSLETGDFVYRYFYLGLWRYTVGEFYDPGPAIELKEKIKTLGYNDAFVAAFRGEQRALDVIIYKK